MQFEPNAVKHEAPRHPKMQDLADRLKIPLYAAIGIMEALWHYAGDYTPRGDLGRVSDKSIAKALDWRGKPETLIEALVSCRWIDLHPQHRLIIHDWHQHAQEWVKKKVSRSREGFLECYTHSLSVDIILSRQNEDNIPPRARLGNGWVGGSGSEGSVEGSQLSGQYRDFLDSWPEDRRGTDLGCQVWISLVDTGEITAANVDEVFAGLGRWKLSEQWRKGFIPAIAKPDGEGWLQKRAWKDYPKAAEVNGW